MNLDDETLDVAIREVERKASRWIAHLFQWCLRCDQQRHTTKYDPYQQWSSGSTPAHVAVPTTHQHGGGKGAFVRALCQWDACAV